MLLTQCGDGAVREWDLAQGALVRTMVGHAGYVHTVQCIPAHAASPCGGAVLSGAEDGRVCLWDVRSPSDAVRTLEPWAVAAAGGNGGKAQEAAAAANASLQGTRWVAALDVDRSGGNFFVAGGGVEQAVAGAGGTTKASRAGFVTVVHLPSFSAVSSATTTSLVQALRFCDDKVGEWVG